MGDDGSTRVVPPKPTKGDDMHANGAEKAKPKKQAPKNQSKRELASSDAEVEEDAVSVRRRTSVSGEDENDEVVVDVSDKDDNIASDSTGAADSSPPLPPPGTEGPPQPQGTVAPKKRITRKTAPRDAVHQYLSLFTRRLPLAVACEAGHAEMVMAMIAAGANPYLRTDGLLYSEVERVRLVTPLEGVRDASAMKILSPFDLTPRRGSKSGANPLSPSSAVQQGVGDQEDGYSPLNSPNEGSESDELHGDGSRILADVVPEDPATVARREALWAQAVAMDAESAEDGASRLGTAPLLFSVARCPYRAAGIEVATLLLVDYLMDANAVDPSFGRIPLHYCMLGEMVDVMVKLGGANVNQKDIAFGQTPLHTAATSSVITALLGLDAAKNSKDNKGRAPTLKPQAAVDIGCCFGFPGCCAIM